MPTPPPDPSSMYRVAAKALIFDDKSRLLVFRNSDDEWEMPGGGWEYGETFAECLGREFMEEMAVGIASVGPVACCWRDYADDARGHRLRLAARAELASTDFKPKGDDGEMLLEARFVTKDEFLALPFEESERGVREYADIIWSTETQLRGLV